MEFQRSASSASSSFSSRFGDHSSLISSSLWPMDQNHCWMPVEHQSCPALPVPASSASAPCFRFFSLCFFSCFPRTHLAQTIRATLGTQSNAKLVRVCPPKALSFLCSLSSLRALSFLCSLLLFFAFCFFSFFSVLSRFSFVFLFAFSVVSAFLLLGSKRNPKCANPYTTYASYASFIEDYHRRSESVEFLLDSVLCQHITKTIWQKQMSATTRASRLPFLHLR